MTRSLQVWIGWSESEKHLSDFCYAGLYDHGETEFAKAQDAGHVDHETFFAEVLNPRDAEGEVGTLDIPPVAKSALLRLIKGAAKWNTVVLVGGYAVDQVTVPVDCSAQGVQLKFAGTISGWLGYNE